MGPFRLQLPGRIRPGGERQDIRSPSPRLQRSSIDGRSLVPLLRGTAPEWRTSFLVEYWSDIVFPRIERMVMAALGKFFSDMGKPSPS